MNTSALLVPNEEYLARPSRVGRAIRAVQEWKHTAVGLQVRPPAPPLVTSRNRSRAAVPPRRRTSQLNEGSYRTQHSPSEECRLGKSHALTERQRWLSVCPVKGADFLMVNQGILQLGAGALALRRSPHHALLLEESPTIMTSEAQQGVVKPVLRPTSCVLQPVGCVPPTHPSATDNNPALRTSVQRAHQHCRIVGTTSAQGHFVWEKVAPLPPSWLHLLQPVQLWLCP